MDFRLRLDFCSFDMPGEGWTQHSRKRKMGSCREADTLPSPKRKRPKLARKMGQDKPRFRESRLHSVASELGSGERLGRWITPYCRITPIHRIEATFRSLRTRFGGTAGRWNTAYCRIPPIQRIEATFRSLRTRFGGAAGSEGLRPIAG